MTPAEHSPEKAQVENEDWCADCPDQMLCSTTVIECGDAKEIVSLELGDDVTPFVNPPWADKYAVEEGQ